MPGVRRGSGETLQLGPAVVGPPLRLLLDENLSPALSAALGDLYPGSAHVRDLGLARASDERVWRAAIEGGYLLASKDSDFHQRSFLRGHPPKVVWIRLGNCTTAEIFDLLRIRRPEIERFTEDPDASFLALG